MRFSDIESNGGSRYMDIKGRVRYLYNSTTSSGKISYRAVSFSIGDDSLAEAGRKKAQSLLAL